MVKRVSKTLQIGDTEVFISQRMTYLPKPKSFKTPVLPELTPNDKSISGTKTMLTDMVGRSKSRIAASLPSDQDLCDMSMDEVPLSATKYEKELQISSPLGQTTFRKQIYDNSSHKNSPKKQNFETPKQMTSFLNPQPDEIKFAVVEQVMDEVPINKINDLVGTPERAEHNL